MSSRKVSFPLPAWLAIVALLSFSAALRANAGTLATATPASTSAALLNNRIVELYRQHASAVVRVKVATEDLDENGKPRISLLVFSGFFISKDGKVLTNSTASTHANRIWIEKDGLSYLADSLGNDPKTNVGLLQVLKLPKKFSYIPIPTDNKPDPIGSTVMAITSPLDFAPTPETGLVSGFESHFANYEFPFTYVRVNIPGGPAEGGSPIINLNGDLVGISVASVPEVRSSYLVPSLPLGRIVKELETNGKVVYGTIAATFSEQPDSLNLNRQVVVASVKAEGSAEKAGLKKGDVVETIAGRSVTSINDVRDAIFFAKIGQFISIHVQRNGNELDFNIPVQSKPEGSQEETPGSLNKRKSDSNKG